MNRSRVLILSLICGAGVATACAKRVHRQVTAPSEPETLDGNAPFLKAHMRDGRLYVLSGWVVDSVSRRVRGSGWRYEADRGVADSGQYLVELDSAALYETNTVRVSGSVAPLAVLTGISVGVTAYCAANPKACFGSCPTFYVHDGVRERLQAEGFSASVAPSLEATDIDALNRVQPRDGRWVDVRMRNEALETHVVRSVNLLAAPRVPGHRVFVDAKSRFWAVENIRAPLACVGEEGDCLRAVQAFDDTERISTADSTDLATRETLELTFTASASEHPALILASRQSLLPTFLLYQAFAYMGRSVGEWLAAFERRDDATKRRTARLVEMLGGIEVLVRSGDGTWNTVETVLETGPLASDVRIVPLPTTADTLHIRLRLAKGAWRIDYVALAAVDGTVEPIRLAPQTVTTALGTDTAARAKLVDPTDVLVTMPGDDYALHYLLSADAGTYEFFLESTGYYLEWMRAEWLAEENRLAALQLFADPAGALRALAPRFKEIEPTLETTFWNSKYVSP
jgi:hypothetical protein